MKNYENDVSYLALKSTRTKYNNSLKYIQKTKTPSKKNISLKMKTIVVVITTKTKS
jgi:hypothetical protein